MKMKKNLEDILADLHISLASELLADIKSGEASSAVLNVARQFLKDNGIDGVPTQENPLGGLVGSLPMFDEGLSANDLPIRSKVEH